MKIKKGDLAYVASDPQEFMEQIMDFFEISEKELLDSKIDTTDPNGDIEGKGVWISYRSTRKDGSTWESSHFSPYPKNFGKGEYIINNEQEAKQTAINFADSVS